MMKTSRLLQIAVLATASFLSTGIFTPTTAGLFNNVEVNGNNFVTIAAPYGDNLRQLLIVEQLSNKQACWSESGNKPINVAPLLMNFDFTGICGRITDSNGYSIRMKGEDFGLDYLVRLVERNGEMVLVGTHRLDPQAPEIEIGRTGGVGQGFEKIILNPGWRLTRRTYQGKALGHIYLTNDSATAITSGPNTNPPPLPSITQPTPSGTQPTPSIPQPTPSITQPLPSNPPRELIFTKPESGVINPEETPSTTPQNVSPTPSPQRAIPTLTLPPRTPSSTTPATKTPTSAPKTLPSVPNSGRQIPSFVVPTIPAK
ncbi:MAG: DUF3747 domain-containing protein [Potamolinea sp.]